MVHMNHSREYRSAIRKNGILPSATPWMGLESVMQVNHTKTSTYDFTEQHRNRATDAENKQVAARGEGTRGGEKQGRRLRGRASSCQTVRCETERGDSQDHQAPA